MTQKGLQNAVAVEPKVWWKSKTLWFNLLTGIVWFLTTQDISFLPIDPKIIGYIILIGNALLRLISDGPISTTQIKPQERLVGAMGISGVRLSNRDKEDIRGAAGEVVIEVLDAEKIDKKLVKNVLVSFLKAFLMRKVNRKLGG